MNNNQPTEEPRQPEPISDSAREILKGACADSASKVKRTGQTMELFRINLLKGIAGTISSDRKK